MSHDAHHPTAGAGPSGGGADPRELLDAYLDGMLEGDELARFESALQADAELRAEVDAQRSINASLSRLFHRAESLTLRMDPNEHAARTDAPATIAPPATSSPPTASVTPPAAPAPPSSTTPPTLKLAGGGEASARGERKRGVMARPISPWYGIAAVLVFSVMAGLYIAGVIDPAEWFGRPAPGLISPEVVYKRKVETGFMPDHVCTTDEEFVKYTEDLLGERLLIPNTDSVQVVGWSSYEPVFSAGTLILMAKVDGEEVLVVMDHAKNDRSLKLSKSSGLTDHSKVFGKVVMHEITPLGEARVLPLVQQK